MRTEDVEHEIAASALAGDAASAHALLERGLSAFRRVRLNLMPLVADGLIHHKSMRSRYVHMGLPRGQSCDLWLVERNHKLLVLHTRGGVKHIETQEVGTAARLLSERLRANVAATLQVLRGIERARKRLFELAEEGTRWSRGNWSCWS